MIAATRVRRSLGLRVRARPRLPPRGAHPRRPAPDGHRPTRRGQQLRGREHGVGTVSQFLPPITEKGIVRRPAIEVGGRPFALAVVGGLDADLNRDYVDDLVAGDGSRGVVTALVSRFQRPWFRTTGPYPTGPLTSIAVGQLDRDSYPDLAVADRQQSRVLVLHGTRRGSFSAPRVALAGVDPVGLLVGEFGGDHQEDLLVADARSRSVRLVLTPGDRLLSAGRPATQVVAIGGGRFAWSERIRPGTPPAGRLGERDGTAASLPPSRRPFVARRGRLRGHRAVSYVRCRGKRCRPFAFDLVRRQEVRLDPRHPRGCHLREIAVWNRAAAYELATERSCRPRLRGLWIDRPAAGRSVWPPSGRSGTCAAGERPSSRSAGSDVAGAPASPCPRAVSGRSRAALDSHSHTVRRHSTGATRTGTWWDSEGRSRSAPGCTGPRPARRSGRSARAQRACRSSPARPSPSPARASLTPTRSERSRSTPAASPGAGRAVQPSAHRSRRRPLPRCRPAEPQSPASAATRSRWAAASPYVWAFASPRLRKKCRSCSHVKPMPPCTCSAARGTRRPASAA